MLQRVRNRIVAFALFFAALALHRFQILIHLELGLVEGMEAGLGWAAKLDTDIPFLGREALTQQRSKGLDKKLACFAIGTEVYSIQSSTSST